MRRCLRFRVGGLASALWPVLLPVVLGLCLGLEAGGTLQVYLRRAGEADARETLAFVMDLRRFIPLAGAVWSAAYFGRELDGGSARLLRSRGFGRPAIYGSECLCFLTGLAVLSLVQQGVALAAVPGWRGLAPAFLLRTLALRLALDLGMMALPGFLPCLGGGSPYARLLGFPYGLALWRLMGSHYELWLPELGRPGLLALLPLAALPVGVLGYGVLAARNED